MVICSEFLCAGRAGLGHSELGGLSLPTLGGISVRRGAESSWLFAFAEDLKQYVPRAMSEMFQCWAASRLEAATGQCQEYPAFGPTMVFPCLGRV